MTLEDVILTIGTYWTAGVVIGFGVLIWVTFKGWMKYFKD